MVVTDSQAFRSVAADTPDEVPLTSFSILMARHKGFLDAAVRGVTAIDRLRDGDTVLISEGCTHHRQCGDIGSSKIPKWLSGHTGRELVYETASGTGFPEDLSRYALVVHCGGCMVNEREVKRRTKQAAQQGVPITHYGTLIAYLHGILGRSLEIFPEYREVLKP
jgi:predicted GTPase